MNARQVNSMLWSGAVLLALGAVGAVLFGLLWPIEHIESITARTAPRTSPSTTSTSLPSMAAYESIRGLSLRQTLGEAIPVPPPVPVPPKAPEAPMVINNNSAGVPVMLAGTIGDSLALLKNPANNSVDVCAVGESSNGVTVLAIRPAEVDVQFNGTVVKLSKPQEPDR